MIFGFIEFYNKERTLTLHAYAKKIENLRKSESDEYVSNVHHPTVWHWLSKYRLINHHIERKILSKTYLKMNYKINLGIFHV